MQRNKKGVVHVIEAIIAAFLLLSFLLFMSQPGEQTGERGQLIAKNTFQTFKALDTAGDLRSPVHRQDLDAVRSLITPYITGRSVETALLTLNTTSRQERFSSTHSATFTVRNTTERQLLRVWYRDAAAPNVSVNNTFIANNTGSVTDTYDVYDIAPHTATGQNTVEFVVSDASTIGYSVDIYDRERSGEPPTSADDVFTTSYVVSGVNTTFFPAEVTAVSWQ